MSHQHHLIKHGITRIHGRETVGENKSTKNFGKWKI
jgi:hypothetical protein